MFTKEQRTIRIYRVFFENLLTGSVDSLLVENTSAEEASTSVLAQLGNDYDLLYCRSVKPSSLS